MHILHVIGARPNFMKVAPVHRALRARNDVIQTIVHTGQHYDFNMSDVFFQELGIPVPDVNLEVGSGSHAQQTAEIMRRFEPVLQECRPDFVLVYGDVNSTIAASLVCSKLLVPVAHVEAGLRSGDRSMPEEINRLLTDQIADLLFTPSKDGDANLLREGVAPSKICLVGNVMIDTLVRMLPQAQASVERDTPDRFVLVTLHRPANVDDLGWLSGLIQTLKNIAAEIPVLFPIHPRTRQRLQDAGIRSSGVSGLYLTDPKPYLEFLGLQTKATAVVTDSGGIQEETTFLGVPCVTMRENTERPITVDVGTNTLVGRSATRMYEELRAIISGNAKQGNIPELWDGKASERIANILTS